MWLSFLVAGLVQRDEVDGDRWVVLSRVSTGPQLDGMSSDAQLSNLQQEVNEMDGDIVEEFERAESAASMDRESLEEIATMGEEDEFDILGVWKLDRLTRADPWESLSYLRRLMEADVVLYAGTHGYFDWHSLYDFELIVRQVVFAREWYERIRGNAKEGYLSHLRDGKWPFGEPHVGYTTDKTKNLRGTDQGERLIPAVFSTYIETENRAETTRRINDRFNLNGECQLTDSQVKTILESHLCVGQLTLKGEVICENSELAVVEKETFNQAKRILNERKPAPTELSEIPEPLNRAAERFGPEFTLPQIECLTIQCPECGGGLSNYGSTIRWEKELKNYLCEDCGFQGPLLSAEEFRELHTTLPLRCPYCTNAEDFEVEAAMASSWEYTYTCQTCGSAFGSDFDPDKYKRAFDRPELAFRISQEIDIETMDQDSVDSNFPPFDRAKVSKSLASSSSTCKEESGIKQRRLSNF